MTNSKSSLRVSWEKAESQSRGAGQACHMGHNLKNLLQNIRGGGVTCIFCRNPTSKFLRAKPPQMHTRTRHVELCTSQESAVIQQPKDQACSTDNCSIDAGSLRNWEGPKMVKL